MANRRMISSDIFNDEWFGPLSFFEQALFIGLFSACADDQGRLQDIPAVIRARVFPYKDVTLAEIDNALSGFQAAGKILRYGTDGKQYLQILHWWEHQQMQWAAESKFPAPDGWLDRVRVTYKGKYITRNWNGKDETPPGDAGGSDTIKEETVPPGTPTWDAHLDRQNLDQNLDLDLNLNQPAVAGITDIVADAPEPQPPPHPVTEGGREYFLQFKRKRWATIAQRTAFETCETEVGTPIMLEAVGWAARKNISDVDRICSAARKMNREKDMPRASPGPPNGHTDEPLSKTRETMRLTMEERRRRQEGTNGKR